VKTGPGYLVQIYLVQIYGMSIFMKCEDLVLKFGFDFGFVSFRLVSFRFDFVSHFTGTHVLGLSSEKQRFFFSPKERP
jgi:hypothetical protein